jgi:hypothetical protein
MRKLFVIIYLFTSFARADTFSGEINLIEGKTFSLKLTKQIRDSNSQAYRENIDKIYQLKLNDNGVFKNINEVENSLKNRLRQGINITFKGSFINENGNEFIAINDASSVEVEKNLEQESFDPFLLENLKLYTENADINW